MALRWYVTTVIGSGTQTTPYRSAVKAVIANGLNYRVEADSRVNDALPAGWMLVRADVTLAQHALLVADARVRYLPLEDVGGNPLGLDDPTSLIPAGVRNAMLLALEAEHTPTQDFTLSMTVGEVLTRIARRARIRQILRADDFSELLDLLISDIPPAKRAAINTKLQAAGIDTSVIQLADTIREALRKIMAQLRV